MLIGCFAKNLVRLGFLYSVSYIKSIPNPQKIICCRENLIFLGLRSPWVLGVRRFHNHTRYLYAFQPYIIWFTANTLITSLVAGRWLHSHSCGCNLSRYTYVPGVSLKGLGLRVQVGSGRPGIRVCG